MTYYFFRVSKWCFRIRPARMPDISRVDRFSQPHAAATLAAPWREGHHSRVNGADDFYLSLVSEFARDRRPPRRHVIGWTTWDGPDLWPLIGDLPPPRCNRQPKTDRRSGGKNLRASIRRRVPSNRRRSYEVLIDAVIPLSLVTPHPRTARCIDRLRLKRYRPIA